MRPLKTSLLLVSVLVVLAVFASTEYVKVFDETYRPRYELRKQRCAICHVDRSRRLNPYGVALRDEMRRTKSPCLTSSVLRAIGWRDSDRDGMSNEREIRAGRNPGVPDKNK